MVARPVIRPLCSGEAPPWRLLLDADPSRKDVSKHLKGGQCYVASLDGAIVGEFVLVKTRPRAAEVMNIAVAPRWRGRGLGRKLIRRAARLAREGGARRLDVGTGNCSLPEIAFYQKCGFRIVGVRRNYFARRPYQSIRENGIPLRDMVRLTMDLLQAARVAARRRRG
jgi:ribosomal protein S18 acetylase RimI-like enzyme